MATSNTLFLIICSNTKRRGGEPGYDPARGLAAHLDGRLKLRLHDNRRKILSLIKKASVTRDDIPLYKLPRNTDLVEGPDFGGSAQAAKYLPAAQRYFGSFYRAMGSDASRLLADSRHHVLIMSGLYGLLLPTEQIQDYSCHIDDDPQIRPAWRAGRLLTEVLLAYCDAHSIKYILDFTALRAYRQLINWPSVGQRGLAVRHAYGRQTVGDGLLVPLGDILGSKWLRLGQSSQLQRIATGELRSITTDTETIHFADDEQPPNGFPREAPQQLQIAAWKDAIVRIARCTKYLLADAGNSPTMDESGSIIERLRRRRQLDKETAGAMYRILERRRDVEHNLYVIVTPADVSDQMRDFALVEKWAKQRERTSLVSECLGD